METTVTIGNVLDAMEKNLHPKVQEHYLGNAGDNGRSACAVGEAAINLGIDYSDLAFQLSGVDIPLICFTNLDPRAAQDHAEANVSGDQVLVTNLNTLIQSLSEATPMPKDNIARWVREHIPQELLDEEIVVAGNTYSYYPADGYMEPLSETDNEFVPEICNV